MCAGFPWKAVLFFFLQGVSREHGPADVTKDLISVCTSSPDLLFDLRKLLQFFAFPLLPSMAVYLNCKLCKRPQL